MMGINPREEWQGWLLTKTLAHWLLPGSSPCLPAVS